MVILAGGPPCPGRCHGHGHVEALCSGTAADQAAQRAVGAGRRCAHAGRARACRETKLRVCVWPRSAAISALRSARSSNVFDPEVVLVGGGFGEAAGELVLGPAEDAARREALEPADASASRRARRARGRGGSRRSRARGLRRARRNLVVRAAGGLRHADRQPRRCHASGSRRAARGGSRPLRGHTSLAHPARASRDRCAASELSPSQRGGSDGRGRVSTGAGRARGTRVRCGPARASTTPVRGWSRRRCPKDCPSRCCRGRRLSRRRSSRAGSSHERYQFLGYLPRRAGELRALAEELAGWSHPVVAFESPRRLPASLAALAQDDARSSGCSLP